MATGKEMMARIFLSKELVDDARLTVASQVADHKRNGRDPTVVVVVATDDEASHSYARAKERVAMDLGVRFRIDVLDTSATQTDLNQHMMSLSSDPMIHGVLLELPLRQNLDANIAMSFLHPHKDIDGLTEFNVSRVAVGDEKQAIAPATPQSCIALATQGTDIDGKLVAVVGRGRTVGRPLAQMLINRGGTVIHCHSGTRDLPSLTKQCDIIFTATGRGGIIGRDHVRPGQILIDAGTDYSSGKVRGDVDAHAVDDIVEAYTPVPRGVGPLTTMFIFRNLMRAIEFQERNAA